jgi:hypothetical protein
MATCPTCEQPVTLASIENPRNGKWTVLPLDGPFETWDIECNFDVLDETHEAVNIMGEVVGEFPVAIHISHLSPGAQYRTHPPSHYLEEVH